VALATLFDASLLTSEPLQSGSFFASTNLWAIAPLLAILLTMAWQGESMVNMISG
jgi:hypothetical protein